MKVLVACEESQRVCMSFRERGHEAYSCDIQECSGGHPEWHICGDALGLVNGRCGFFTEDGTYHSVDGKWDLLIAHPPCTYLSVAGSRHVSLKCTTAEKVIDRLWKVAESAVFFMQFALADCDRICVENPLGYMSRLWRLEMHGVKPYRIFIYLLVTSDIDNAVQRVECLKKFRGITIYAQAERNERLGIVPNKLQLEFAQRYIYSGKFRKETWSEYCKRLKIRK